MPQLYMEYFRRGVKRTYAYEFANSQALSTTNIEANFGLLKLDLTPKPSFTNLKNMMTLLGDTSTSFAPEQLDFSISGPSTLRHVLLQKSDGSWWMAIWNDVQVWDPIDRVDLFPANAQATVSFASAPESVNVYDPTKSTTAISTATGAGSVALSVPVSPLLVKVSGAAAPTPGSHADADADARRRRRSPRRNPRRSRHRIPRRRRPPPRRRRRRRRRPRRIRRSTARRPPRACRARNVARAGRWTAMPPPRSARRRRMGRRGMSTSARGATSTASRSTG